MTSTINASTSSGIVQTADTSGVLAIQANGTTGMTFGPGAAVATSTPINTPGVSLAFKNRIINGGMTIDQRNAGASVSATGYCLDRWCSAVVASKLTVQQVADAPSGFINSAKYTVSSQYSPGSTDQFIMYQAIEGVNISDLGWGTANAQPVTVSFWVKGSVAGTYCANIFNSSGSHSYIFSFPVTTSWVKQTATIPGCTNGTWLTTNGIGLYFSFDLGSGSNYNAASANSWVSGNYRNIAGATIFCNQAVGSTIQFTGVQLEVGTAATSFEFRDYGRELALCQRYYEIFTGNANATELLSGFFASSTNCYLNVYYKQTKRAKPTVTAPTGWVNITPGVWPSVDNCVFNGGGYFYINAGDGVTALTVSAEL